ncbi:MAG: hypothetical protein WA705_15395 [Candidatus Ozemobacteraceae bacterium]
MSSSYQIRIPVHLTLSEDDRARTGRMNMHFGLLGMLDPDRMRQLLTDALHHRGWKEESSGTWTRVSTGGAVLHLDPAALTLEIDVTADLPSHLLAGYFEPGDTRIQTLETKTSSDIDALGLTGDAAANLQAQLGQMNANASQRLVRETMNARRELNETLKDVYREAVKEKATSLGTVSSVDESSTGGSWRVRIEIV